MPAVRDIGGEEAEVLLGLPDFEHKRVLEVGCGDGRLTRLYGPRAASVLGIDPDEESIGLARSELPAELGDRVRFEVARVEDLSKTEAFDLAFLSWSL